MADLYDLLNLVKADPTAMKRVLADRKRVAEFGLTSAELGALKKMDPEHLRVILESIEERLRVGPVAGTNACPGTFACFDKPAAAARRR